ncbi:MAG: hypothetical protein HFH45_04020 [Bacilli bacterium]|nr:hypothetical protein [Bacilli bacterium]
MTDEEIDLIYKEMEESCNNFNVRNFHYASSGPVPEKYQDLYYGLQKLDEKLDRMLENEADNSVITKVIHIRKTISNYLEHIMEFGAYNDLNVFFGCDINEIIPKLNKDIDKIQDNN